MQYQIDSSPIGKIIVVSHCDSIVNILFENQKNVLNNYPTIVQKSNKAIETCFYQLKKYFNGEFIRHFDIKIKTIISATSYTKSVHKAIQEHAGYGKVLSYSKLACLMNKPSNYARSVATACSKNRIQIVVGCHRIVAVDGKLSGYAGEIWRKKYLLELEESVIKQQTD